MKELSIEKLLKGKENPKLILEAFEFAKEIYKDKKRQDNKLYRTCIKSCFIFR